MRVSNTAALVLPHGLMLQAHRSFGIPEFISLVLTIALIVAVIRFLSKVPLFVQSSWLHYYDNMKFSTTAFRELVEARLKEKGFAKFSIKTEDFFDSHLFSTKRSYLCVSFREYRYYISAATFDTGTFVSWWLCTKKETFLGKIPFINNLFGKDRKNKTFYQMDTDAMLKYALHSIVVSAAQEMAAQNGGERKPLTELELQITNNPK